MTSRKPVDRFSTLRLVGALLGLSAVLGACTQTSEIVTASVPTDYRQRHPIAVHEADRSIVVFVGRARGGLSAPQRTDVMGLAQTWSAKAPARSSPTCRSRPRMPAQPQPRSVKSSRC